LYKTRCKSCHILFAACISLNFLLVFVAISNATAGISPYGLSSEQLSAWHNYEQLAYSDPQAGLRRVEKALSLVQTSDVDYIYGKLIYISFLVNLERAALAEEEMVSLKAIPDWDNNRAIQAKVLSLESDIYRTKGDYSQALDKQNQAMGIAQALGLDLEMAETKQRRSYVHIQQGNYGPALKDAVDAYQIQKKINNPPAIASALQSIATIYVITGETQKAIEYYLDAAKILEEKKYPFMMSTLYFSLGNAFNRTGELDQAQKYLELTADLSEQLSDHSTVAYANYELGNLHLNLSAPAKACPHYTAALDYFETTMDAKLVTLAHSKLARCHLVAEALGQAEQHLDYVLANINDNTTNAAKVQFYKIAIDLYMQQDRPAQALRVFQLYHHAYVEYEKVNQAQSLRKLRVKYDTERQEQINQELRLTTAHQEQDIINKRRGLHLLLLTLGAVIIVGGLAVTALVIQVRGRKQVEQLLQQKEALAIALDTANHKKDRFLAAISHDIRQPLQALVYLTESLCNRPHYQPHLANQTRAAVVNLNQLVNTIFDIARLDNGVIETHTEVFELDVLLLEVQRDYSAIFESSNIAFQRSTIGIGIECDKNLLRHILGILLDNVLKHSSASVVSLTSCQHDDKLTVTVADNGKGIQHEQREKIFDEFYQADTGVRRLERGMGLGLALCKRLTALLDISVQVTDSPFATGIAFTLEIPSTAVTKKTKNSPTTLSYSPSKPLERPLNLWIIEDDLAIADAFSVMLKNWGVHTHIISDQNTLNHVLAKAAKPDLLIADLNLQGLPPGDRIIEHIRDTVGSYVEALIVTGEIFAAPSISDIPVYKKPVSVDVIYQALTHIASLKKTCVD